MKAIKVLYRKLIMDGWTIIKIIGMLATLVFLGFLLKELIKSIKESKEGRVSGKCDHD
jgi:hypothetical protein